MKSLEERVHKLVADHLAVPQERVTNDARLRKDLGADSLDAVELVMACEENFSCEITDRQAENINTVQDLLDVLRASGGR